MKYIPTREWVKVMIKRIDQKIHFCVSDNGMGIRAEDMPKLFAKFSRGTDMGLEHPEGSGLGLYVAMKMVPAFALFFVETLECKKAMAGERGSQKKGGGGLCPP